MRRVAHSAFVAVIALVGAVLLAVSSIFMGAFALAATAVIVPGTGTPDPTVPADYMNNAVGHYVAPNVPACALGPCTQVPVKYYAQFWPIPLPGWGGLQGQKWNVSVGDGLDHLEEAYFGNADKGIPPVDASQPIVVFGYSQGSTVSSLFKGHLIAHGGIPSGTSFVLIGNPQRPNGGFFERWAILGTVPILDATFGEPTPNTGIDANGNPIAAVPANTTDIALQYDGVADFPTYPINPLATLNALAGFEFIHGTYLAPDDGEGPDVTPYGYTPAEIVAIQQGCQANPSGPNCQRYGDTMYITIPARTLPLMQPFLDLGAATGTSALVIPVVDLVSPLTQTLIETGYDRSNYGVATPARLIPRINPVTLASDLVNDIPEGIHAALTPGLDPLAGSTRAAGATRTTTSDAPPTTVASATAGTSRAAKDTRTLVRPSMIAIPNLGLGKAGEVEDRSKVFGGNMSGAHPVRDAMKAASDTVQTVLKRITDGATRAGDSAKTGSAAASAKPGAGSED